MKDVEKICVTGIKDDRLMMFVMDMGDGGDYGIRRVFCFPEGKETSVHSILCAEDAIFMADAYNNSLYKCSLSGQNNDELTVGKDPRHMCCEDGYIYVTNFESDSISVVDTEGFNLTGTIPADIKPHDVISSGFGRLYVSCYEENRVLEYSGVSGERKYFSTDGKPMHLFKDGDCLMVMAYFTNGSISSKINFINIKTSEIEDIIKIKGLCSNMDYDAANKKLYIINIDDKNLYIIDVSNRNICRKLHLGGYPEDVACGHKYVYLTNSRKDSVTLINPVTLKDECTVELGFSPLCVKYMC